MKVLHVVNVSFVLPYYLGDQITYMSERGILLSIACSPSAHFSEFTREYKIDSLELQVKREFNVWADIVAIVKLFRYIKNKKIDIVIGHTPKGALLAMLASSLALTPKRIYFRHGLMFETSNGIKRKLLVFIEKITARLATDVVCVSKSVMLRSEELKLSSPFKHHLLNKGTCNGIDFIKLYNPAVISVFEKQILKKKYEIPDNTTVIGYAGRLVKDKGIPELLDAWSMLIQKYKNCMLLLVGPFEERDAIDEEYKKMILNHESIRHTGLIKKPQQFYAIMDIFILPSRREGFPTVVLEASAMCLPVITTRSTGCIDSIIENKTGIFADISSDSILDSIIYYLENPGKRIEHGICGREFVTTNFNQQIVWDEIQKIFKSK